MPGTTAWGARLTPTTTTTTEGRPQGDHREGHQEPLEHPERQAPLGREDQGREDQGREVRLQTGNQEQEIRQPVMMTTRDRGDMDRRDNGEESLVGCSQCYSREQMSQYQTMGLMMAKRQQKQLPRMEMMMMATIRNNPRSLLEDRPEVHHQPPRQLVPSKLSPAPHLLLRYHRHPCGTRDSLMEDPVLPPDQKNTPSAPLESLRKHSKQKKQTMRSK